MGHADHSHRSVTAFCCLAEQTAPLYDQPGIKASDWSMGFISYRVLSVWGLTADSIQFSGSW